MDDWRGYVIAGFALVWIANVYMSLFARIRIELKKERTEVSVLEKQERQQEEAMDTPDPESESGVPPTAKRPEGRSKQWTNEGDRHADRRYRV